MILGVIFNTLRVEASDINQSTWVYDETGNISEETIDYINELNNGKLKNYQYAVYLVKTLNGQNIDDYKLQLFNELGIGDKEHNQGILFIIVTEDRKYGLEIGDGFTGTLRDRLSTNFIDNNILNDMRNSDWDSAVYKVSEKINNIIPVELTPEQEKELIEQERLQAVENARQFKKLLGGLLIFILLGGIITLVIDTMQKNELNKTFNSEKVQNFLNHYGIECIDDVKKELRDSMGKDLDETLYNIFIVELSNKIKSFTDTGILNSDYNLVGIDKESVSLLQLDSIDNICKNIIDKRNNIEKHNISEFTEAKSICKASKLDRQLFEQVIFNLQPITLYINSGDTLYTKQDLADKIDVNYRKYEIEDKVRTFLLGQDTNYINNVINSLRNLSGYNAYINWRTDNFEFDTLNLDNENTDDLISTSTLSSDDKWMKLYLYSRHRYRVEKMQEEKRIMQEKERIAQEERMRNNNSSFGSSFGGGKSSGGGFSGSF